VPLGPRRRSPRAHRVPQCAETGIPLRLRFGGRRPALQPAFVGLGLLGGVIAGDATAAILAPPHHVLAAPLVVGHAGRVIAGPMESAVDSTFSNHVLTAGPQGSPPGSHQRETPLLAEPSCMRRRGLEPPPGYPGPGPQPGNSGVISVRIAPDRPNRPGMRTIRTLRTIWMLPRMLPRAGRSRVRLAEGTPSRRVRVCDGHGRQGRGGAASARGCWVRRWCVSTDAGAPGRSGAEGRLRRDARSRSQRHAIAAAGRS
jgi:hypothetical protein